MTTKRGGIPNFAGGPRTERGQLRDIGLALRRKTRVRL